MERQPSFPLRTHSPPYFQPPTETKKQRPMGPPIDHMKLFIGVVLVVAVLGFFMWKNKQPPPAPPPPIPDTSREEMERNISSLHREVTRLQKTVSAKLAQDQKLEALEQSQRLLLNKIDELTQRKSRTPSPQAKNAPPPKVEDELPPPPPL